MRQELDVVLKQKVAKPRLELYDPCHPDSSPTSKLIQAIIDLITQEDYSRQVNITIGGGGGGGHSYAASNNVWTRPPF